MVARWVCLHMPLHVRSHVRALLCRTANSMHWHVTLRDLADAAAEGADAGAPRVSITLHASVSVITAVLQPPEKGSSAQEHRV